LSFHPKASGIIGGYFPIIDLQGYYRAVREMTGKFRVEPIIHAVISGLCFI
jgi:hypothetical protein